MLFYSLYFLNETELICLFYCKKGMLWNWEITILDIEMFQLFIGDKGDFDVDTK